VPKYKSIVLDLDANGTTDKAILDMFIKSSKKTFSSMVIYSTFQLAENLLSTNNHCDDDVMVLVDKAHNLTCSPSFCKWLQGISRVTIMSATLPQELFEELQIEHISKVPFSKGLEGGYIVDYTIWLPLLTKDSDGSSSVVAKILVEFALYPRNVMMKVLYHATCMMRTGSRCTIVYLNSQDECDEYMSCFQKVIEDYHCIEDIWVGKIMSVVDSKQQTLLLSQFQGGTKGSFCALTSVRILD
jgi:hypothetical protein